VYNKIMKNNHIKKVKTIKFMKEVLANYEGRYCKFMEDGKAVHFVTVNWDEWYFDSKDEMLKWASVYFWNRDMHRIGYNYGC